MAVIVEIPAALRRFAADNKTVAVEGSATVGKTLASLVSEHPRLKSQLFTQDDQLFGFVGIFVNAQDVRHRGRGAAPVKPGDVITLIPAIAGG